MIVAGLGLEAEPGAVLLVAVEAAAVLELLPRGARHRDERAGCVYALDEVLVAANVVAAQESLDT